MKITVEFQIGEWVYMIHDPDQLRRMVTGYIIREGELLYIIACGESEVKAFGFELSDERNIIGLN